MRAHATNEMDVIGASADEVWAVYGSKDLWKLMVKLQPDVFERVNLVAFDGGVGTIIHMVMTPGKHYLFVIFGRMFNFLLIRKIQFNFNSKTQASSNKIDCAF